MTTDPGHEQLEAERDFLLRSLDDLEAEHDAGGIDDESYETLRDDYTARAAAAIRALEEGGEPAPARPEPVSWKRRALVIGGIVVFVVVVAVGLAAALGARLPGQTASGNSQASAPPKASGPTDAQLIKRLEGAIAKNPDDVQTRLLLAPRLEATGDLAGALKQYDAVMVIQPTNAAAEANAGRLLYLTAEQSVKSNPDAAAQLVTESKARLDHAIALDPNYPDTYYFHAIVLANEYGDFKDAQSDLQRYIVLAPDGTWAGPAHDLLAQVSNALEPPSTTTTTSPKKKK